MATFLRVVEKVARLKRKQEIYDLTKNYVEGLASSFDLEIVNEVLLDLDELCVGPLLEEIYGIENSRVTKPKAKTTEKKDGKAKAGKKQVKKEGKKNKKGKR